MHSSRAAQFAAASTKGRQDERQRRKKASACRTTGQRLPQGSDNAGGSVVGASKVGRSGACERIGSHAQGRFGLRQAQLAKGEPVSRCAAIGSAMVSGYRR
ncbi:hypothetical protein C0Z19_09655 [Trinickia soli]|uniref:Uncharacterized protein n=1 Tax=Trinickia soli TaxID=380675 RepID=A0A2N7W8S0_9BURK|nr:hypothetical protein C0Z19_09655 [Trinickia soli]